jgi:hypothetical protein
MVNFFKGLLSQRQPGIGIEIAPDRINIIQLEKKAQALKLGILASTEVPEPFPAAKPSSASSQFQQSSTKKNCGIT